MGSPDIPRMAQGLNCCDRGFYGHLGGNNNHRRIDRRGYSGCNPRVSLVACRDPAPSPRDHRTPSRRCTSRDPSNSGLIESQKSRVGFGLPKRRVVSHRSTVVVELCDARWDARVCKIRLRGDSLIGFPTPAILAFPVGIISLDDVRFLHYPPRSLILE